MAHINYDLPELRAFLQVAARGSFHGAAHSLGLSPSALSRRILRLEEQMGARLLDRMTRSVVLTASGRSLLAAAGPAIAELDDRIAETVLHASGGGGRISVGCVTTVACSIFPRVLRTFRTRFPDVRVRLHDDTGKRVLEGVLAGRVEFAVNTLLQPHPGTHAERLAMDAYVVAVPAGHALSGNGSLRWAAIQGYRLVGLKRSSANRQQVDDAMVANGIALQWFDEVEHLSSMLGFLREGQSVGVLPRMALLGQPLPRIRIRALTHPTVERTIGLIRRADASLSVSAQALWDLVSAALVDFAREK